MLISSGFREEEVLDMALNRFYLYVESASRSRAEARKAEVSDLVAAIQMALSGKGLKEYLNNLSVDGDGRKP